MDSSNTEKSCDYRKIPKVNGKLLIECSNCGNQEHIQEDQFNFEEGSGSDMLTLTDRIFKQEGRAIIGWAIGFVIAFASALILIVAFAPPSNLPHWITITGAMIWMASANVINGMLTTRLPIWSHICSNCKKTHHIASNGKTSLIVGNTSDVAYQEHFVSDGKTSLVVGNTAGVANQQHFDHVLMKAARRPVFGFDEIYELSLKNESLHISSKKRDYSVSISRKELPLKSKIKTRHVVFDVGDKPLKLWFINNEKNLELLKKYIKQI
ncbi:MAG: hypothetical protein K9J85_05295 [Desulfobacteraceae bacterium]|nr:hypothetical protein [Desulfobacteraceae bacterium]